MDDDFDGCIDEEAVKGKAPCTCTAGCSKPTCSPPATATCDPYNGGKERCANGRDDNCNGLVDEGCAPKTDSCFDKAGADPILLGTRSAVTEPFTDFTAESVVSLSLTRTYTSADASLAGEAPHGSFGPGWHHEWEGSLSCDGGVCTVSEGLAGAWRFTFSTVAPSLDGTQSWEIYRPWKDDVTAPDSTALLVRRPDGVWVHHRVDGRELHFATVCDPCDVTAATCVDPLAGGVARLVEVVDEKGNAISVGYDRPSGLLLVVADGLGHALELRGESACGAGLATELRYDGMTVATYAYDGLDLVAARDAEGQVLRSYVYEPLAGGYLQAVLNEAGTAIAEFWYDGVGDAIGVVDAASSVGVSYAAGLAQVTEHYGAQASSTSARTLDMDGHVTSVSEGCACGEAQTLTWLDKRLACTADASGRMTYTKRDALGRAIERAELATTTCPPTDYSLSSAPRRELFGYGVKKAVAQGVELELDRQTSVTRASVVNGSGWATESWDYKQGPDAIDPPGYACTEAPLPAGAVVCRHVRTGYVGPSGSTIRERHATFYSYDGRGRLVRTYGPVSIEPVSASDVVPIEERVYWPDTAALQRRGRLMELRQYASPTSAPLVTRYDYDAFGVYQTVAPNGGLTTIVKDGRGRPIFVLGPDGSRAELRYYDGLSPRLRLSPSGAAVRFGYDAKGRLATTERLDRDPEAGVATVAWSEHRTYDDSGNAVHVERRDGEGAVTWRQDREYDVQHRIVKERHPEDPALARAFAYDATGFLSSVTDEEGRATVFTPDLLRRVSKVRRTGFDAQGTPIGLDVAKYVYGRQVDSVQEVTDGNLWPTAYSRDDFGRLQGVATSTHPYPPAYKNDVRGNLRQRKSASLDYYGRSYTPQVDYTYDGLDRLRTLTARNYVDGATVAYTLRYDEPGGEGYLTSVVEPERTIRFAYDVAGRRTRETVEESGVAVPLVTEYGYDADGDLVSIDLPSGARIRYVLDPATKRAVRVEDAATGVAYADAVRWLPGGPVTSFTFGNGLSLTQTFDARYQPRTVTSGPLQLGYGMTPAGDVGALTEGATSRTFKYDFLDRLTGSPGWLSYGYDGNGNRTTESVEGASATWTYPVVTDRLKEKLGPGGVSQLAIAYDRDANVSGIARYNGTIGLDAYCLRHDPLGRLGHAGKTSPGWIVPGGYACVNDDPITLVTARFKYDHRNRRVASWKAATGEWVYTAFGPGGEPLAELAKTTDPAKPWRPVREYVWLEGKPVAQIEHDAATGAARTYAVHVDQIGLPRALTSPGGVKVWTASVARPYGDVTEATVPDPETGKTVVTNLRLPGQYDERLLASVGLQGPYYNWNRWYLPSVGRYLELDPIAKAGGFNTAYGVDWYGYGGSNPTRNSDRDGRMSAVFVGVVVGVAVLGLGVYLFKDCLEKCTGAKLGGDPECPSDHSDKKKEADCIKLCVPFATLPTCIGLGDAANCIVQEGINQANGDPNGDSGN